MADAKTGFIELLVESGALLHGKFQLKNGKESEYYVDFGRIADGHHLLQMGISYAERLAESDIGLDSFDVIYGPAYKGIPIATATVIAINTRYSITKRFVTNRKEAKTHGDARVLIGTSLAKTDRVVIIDDVFTDGGAKLEAVDLLKHHGDPSVSRVLVGVDRSEPQAIERFEKKTDVRVDSICSMDEVRRAFAASEQLRASASAHQLA